MKIAVGHSGEGITTSGPDCAVSKSSLISSCDVYPQWRWRWRRRALLLPFDRILQLTRNESKHGRGLREIGKLSTIILEFLEAYNALVADGNEADPLEMHIADAAYAAEDVIESHIVDNIDLQNKQTSSLASKISGFFNYFQAPEKPEHVEEIKSINFYQDLKQVIEEMDSIKLVVMKIDTEKAVVVHDRDVCALAAPSRSFSCSNAIVCPEAVSRGIMDKLTGDRLDRQVISIVGMGGIGKTTLTRNIYARKVIREYFSCSCLGYDFSTIQH